MKKHRDQLKRMFEKFCERKKIKKTKDAEAAFRFGYLTGHRTARVRTLTNEK